jgi:hypothetical protein
MIYILYLLLVPISLILTILAILLAPILPLFATNNYLPSWLSWFQTPDNSLAGDASFQAANGTGYLASMKWLLRNPAYGFAVRYLNAPFTATFSGNNKIGDNATATAGWLFVKANGLFQFAWVFPIGFSRCLYVNLGWNIRALVDDNVNPKPNPYQATFVFSPRISGFN